MFTDWTIPFVFCDIYIGMDVICSTASIFNLVAISIDRYHAVSSPLKYSQEQQSNDHSRIIRAIAFIWIVSSLVGLPILLGFNVSTDPDDSFDCRFYDANFVIVSSVASFYIPCCIILVLYYKIMKVGAETRVVIRREIFKLKKQLFFFPLTFLLYLILHV